MRAIAKTDIGLVRSENQDTFRFEEIGEGYIVLVCDCMGGLHHGI